MTIPVMWKELVLRCSVELKKFPYILGQVSSATLIGNVGTYKDGRDQLVRTLGDFAEVISAAHYASNIQELLILFPPPSMTALQCLQQIDDSGHAGDNIRVLREELVSALSTHSDTWKHFVSDPTTMRVGLAARAYRTEMRTIADLLGSIVATDAKKRKLTDPPARSK